MTSHAASPPKIRPGGVNIDLGQRSGSRHLFTECKPLRSRDNPASLCLLLTLFLSPRVSPSTVCCNTLILIKRSACLVPARNRLRPFLGPLQIGQVRSDRLAKNLYLWDLHDKFNMRYLHDKFNMRYLHDKFYMRYLHDKFYMGYLHDKFYMRNLHDDMMTWQRATSNKKARGIRATSNKKQDAWPQSYE